MSEMDAVNRNISKSQRVVNRESSEREIEPHKGVTTPQTICILLIRIESS